MARTQAQQTRWAGLMLPISIILLVHLFLPHHHHYNSFHSEREAEEQMCAVEITDALLRVSSEPDSQCPAAPFHVHTVPLGSFLLPALLVALVSMLGEDPGQRHLFKPYISHYHAPWGSVIRALRAPPVVD